MLRELYAMQFKVLRPVMGLPVATGTADWPWGKAQCVHMQLPRFDASKARKELGLDFIDIRQTAQEMAASLLELGVIKRLPGAPKPDLHSRL